MSNGFLDKNSYKLGLPDVSSEVPADHSFSLEKVGMTQIEMPVIYKVGDGPQFRLPAAIEAYVSLDNPEAKGIHMSRLYLGLQQVLSHEQVCLRTLKHLLTNFISGQKGLSQSAHLKISFDLPVERKALVSDAHGWRHYPVFYEGRVSKGLYEFAIGVRVTYSSTCPCSAALAQQHVLDQFHSDFLTKDTIQRKEVEKWLQLNVGAATPHAQRSYADVKVRLDARAIAPEALEIIDHIEAELQTPVQAAVKREDEQEFARLNGRNAMYCEDAARRIKRYLEAEPRILDYHLRVDHRESLHAHNAVSVTVKGIEGGFQPY